MRCPTVWNHSPRCVPICAGRGRGGECSGGAGCGTAGASRRAAGSRGAVRARLHAGLVLEHRARPIAEVLPDELAVVDLAYCWEARAESPTSGESRGGLLKPRPSAQACGALLGRGRRPFQPAGVPRKQMPCESLRARLGSARRRASSRTWGRAGGGGGDGGGAADAGGIGEAGGVRGGPAGGEGGRASALRLRLGEGSHGEERASELLLTELR